MTEKRIKRPFFLPWDKSYSLGLKQGTSATHKQVEYPKVCFFIEASEISQKAK